MSLQTILSICEQVGINDQRFVGQTISRNQKIVTSEVLTVVPFVFQMQPMNYLLYSQNRGVLNALRIADKAQEQYLNFGTTGWLNYIKYQGSMTPAQISACQWQASSAQKTLVLGSLPAVSSSTVLFRVGDFVQFGRYAYIVTEEVLRGIGSTVIVPVHRSLISGTTSTVSLVAGQFGTTTGFSQTYTGITFPVILREYPTYTLVPITNDSFIQWNGQFTAFESVL